MNTITSCLIAQEREHLAFTEPLYSTNLGLTLGSVSSKMPRSPNGFIALGVDLGLRIMAKGTQPETRSQKTLVRTQESSSLGCSG